MSDTQLRIAFSLLVMLVAAQRVWELARSQRNEKALRARGAREHAPRQMPAMRLLHAAWLLGMLLETWSLERALSPWIAIPALAAFLAGQALRLAAMRALGDRWSVKVLTVPGAPHVAGGVFAHLRHPNYVGVILEIAALPLVGGAVLTAVVASLANAVLLRFRIRAEESALIEDGDYARMRDVPRFVPRFRRGQS